MKRYDRNMHIQDQHITLDIRGKPKMGKPH
jgi:hypothetical protein